MTIPVAVGGVPSDGARHGWLQRDLTFVDLLHPAGFAERVYRPERADTTATDATRELIDAHHGHDAVVVMSTDDERRTAGWLPHAMSIVDQRLAWEGVAYIVVPRSAERAVLRAIAAHPLRLSGTFVHVPFGPSAEYVARCDASGLGLLANVLPMRRLREAVLRAVVGGRVATSWLPLRGTRLGFAIQRPDAPPLFLWARRDPERDTTVKLARLKHHGPSGIAVLWAVGHAERWPEAIIKRALTKEGTARVLAEREALDRFGVQAAQAGAAVPSIEPGVECVASARYRCLDGLPADAVLASSASRLRPIVAQLADWLSRWNNATRVNRTIEMRWVRDELLEPARAVSHLVDAPEAYFRWLGETCARLNGRTVSLVDTHADLTMSNVLVDGTHPLGIVDWESARHSSLPLSDFLYAAADARAAAGRYRRRAEALEEVFAGDSEYARFVAHEAVRVDPTCSADPDLLQVVRHATILQHAVHEAAKQRSGEQPFARTVRLLSSRVTSRR